MMILVNTILLIFIVFNYISKYKNYINSSDYVSSLLQAFSKSDNNATPITLYIIIPALNEQNIISKTVNYIYKLLTQQNNFNFKILVTLHTYEKPGSNGKTTKVVLEEFCRKRSNMSEKIATIEYSGNFTSRAKQLNAALESIKKEFTQRSEDLNNVWVAIYDADSHPHRYTFNYFHWHSTTNQNIKAYQQCVDYRLNINNIKNKVLKANSVHHTARNYISELPFFIQSINLIKQNLSPDHLPYFMGHGMFFHFNSLIEIGGFSENGFCDGMQIGVNLTLNKLPFDIIPFPDYCESPVTVKSMVNQHSMWFLGRLSLFSYIFYYRKHGIFITIKRTFNNIKGSLLWLLCPLLYFYVFITSLILIFDGKHSGIIFILILCALMLFYPHLINISCKRDKIITSSFHTINTNLKNPLWINMAILFRSLGPWVGVLKKIYAHLFNIQLRFQKMKR